MTFGVAQESKYFRRFGADYSFDLDSVIAHRLTLGGRDNERSHGVCKLTWGHRETRLLQVEQGRQSGNIIDLGFDGVQAKAHRDHCYLCPSCGSPCIDLAREFAATRPLAYGSNLLKWPTPSARPLEIIGFGELATRSSHTGQSNVE
jgi:hypothetical protein